MDLIKQELIKKRLEINYKIKIFTKLLKEHENNIEIKKVFLIFIYDLRKERKILKKLTGENQLLDSVITTQKS